MIRLHRTTAFTVQEQSAKCQKKVYHAKNHPHFSVLMPPSDDLQSTKRCADTVGSFRPGVGRAHRLKVSSIQRQHSCNTVVLARRVGVEALVVTLKPNGRRLAASSAKRRNASWSFKPRISLARAAASQCIRGTENGVGADWEPISCRSLHLFNVVFGTLSPLQQQGGLCCYTWRSKVVHTFASMTMYTLCLLTMEPHASAICWAALENVPPMYIMYIYIFFYASFTVGSK